MQSARTYLIGLSLALMACGGGRSERIGSQCVSDAQCSDGSHCEAQRCVESASAAVEARGAVEGAPPSVRIEQQVVGDESCEVRDAKLVCLLTRGSKLVLVAPEVDGYRFVGWSGEAQCRGSERVLSLTEVVKNIECVARYVRRLRVTGSVAGEEGSLVLASAEGEFSQCEEASCLVDQGTLVTLTAPERDGFRIAGFQGAGCEEQDGYRALVTPTQADVSCVANYVESLTVRGQVQGIAPEAAEMARIEATSPAPNAVCQGQLCGIDPGQTVTLLAPEVPGYRFRGWIGDALCSGSELELNVSDVATNIVCTADYVRRFTVLAESAGLSSPELMPSMMALANDGFASCDGARCEVDQGGTVTLLAGTVRGFRLRDWTGEGCIGADGSSALAREVQADVTCVANFVAGVSVSGTVVNAEASVEASSSATGASCGNGRCAIDVGGTVTLTAPALTGRTFRGWSGDEGCTGSARTLTLSAVEESKDCRATFAPRYQAQGRAAPAAGGTVVAASTSTNARCMAGTCEVDEGGTVTLTATSAENFRFTGYSGGGACTGSAARLELRDVRAGITCNANFIGRIQVSGESAPAAAAQVMASSLSTAAQCAGASCTVDSGNDVMLRATVAPGYRFTRWSGCGAASDPRLLNNPLLVAAPTASTRCTANFETITYTVAATAATGGNVSGEVDDRACPGASCTVAHGGSASFTARAAAGYSFTGWTGCVTSDEPEISVEEITQNQTCRANFTRMRFTVSAIPGSGGSVAARTGGSDCANARCTVDYGASVVVTATAQSGAEFVAWSGCSTSSERSITLDDITQNQSCTANFRALEYTVRGLHTPSEGGSVNCANGCTVRHGASISLTASANTSQGYRFAGWSDCTPAMSNPLPLSNVTSDRSCTARFERIPVTVGGGTAPANVGSVIATSMSMGASCTGASCSVLYGDTVTLTARYPADYRLINWSGDAGCSGTSNAITLRSLTGSVRCTANLELKPVTVRGSVTPNVGRVVVSTCGAASCSVPYGGRVTLTAESLDAGYRFANWSGTGCSGTSSNLVITSATSDLNCTANFVRSSFEATFVAQTTLANVQIEASGATCANNRCTRTVVPSDTVTVDVAFTTPTTQAIPVFAGWSGCRANSTEVTVVSTNNGSFSIRYTSTFSGFDAAATCNAQIVEGSFMVFATTNTFPLSTRANNGYCTAASQPGGVVNYCFVPPSTSVNVSSTVSSWTCSITSVVTGFIDDPVYNTSDLAFTSQGNVFVICGGQ